MQKQTELISHKCIINTVSDAPAALSRFIPVQLVFIIDEAEAKGRVQRSAISYQKANLNLPRHDQTLFQSHGG